jgi:hypothetical protein
MNERGKELAELAGINAKEISEDGWLTLHAFKDFDLELFEKLVRQDERNLNAKLCEEYQFDFARAIREGHRL